VVWNVVDVTEVRTITYGIKMGHNKLEYDLWHYYDKKSMLSAL
jgi:hypothetical protein